MVTAEQLYLLLEDLRTKMRVNLGVKAVATSDDETLDDLAEKILYIADERTISDIFISDVEYSLYGNMGGTNNNSKLATQASITIRE